MSINWFGRIVLKNSELERGIFATAPHTMQSKMTTTTSKIPTITTAKKITKIATSTKHGDNDDDNDDFIDKYIDMNNWNNDDSNRHKNNDNDN